MEGVRVLDASGKVLYTFEAIGGTVSVGRDKKKCGIALPINAQGVSRVHGSFRWITENELSFTDSSTYGTSVDGTLVKNGSETVRDGAHVLVGDVELIISFPQQRTLDSICGDNLMTAKQGTSTKRKSVTSVGSQKESKRSKLSSGVNNSRQSQVKCFRQSSREQSTDEISSFLVKKPLVIDDDDDFAVLAEDTPYSQATESVKSTSRNMISFVKDSLALSTNPQKPDGMSLSNGHTSSKSTGRRKKQCIFDVNIRPTLSGRTMVLAEDTQPEPAISSRSKEIPSSRTVANVTTCIPDTCNQKTKDCDEGIPENYDPQAFVKRRGSTDDDLICAPSDISRICGTTMAFNKDVFVTSSIAPKISASSTQNSGSARNDNSSFHNRALRPTKTMKASVFDSIPVEKQGHPTEVVDGFSDDDLVEPTNEPDENTIMQRSSRCDQKTRSSSETIQATAATCTSSLLRKASQRTSRKKTSIFDPIPTKKQPPAAVVHSVSDDDDVIAVGDVDMAATARSSSTFGYKITASPILSNRSSHIDDTSSAYSRNTKRPAKKSSIFDPKRNKKQQLSTKVEDSIPDDESEPIEQPDVKDILKLVSSGKRYDNGDDEAETEDTKGLEIERVVAKLSELVHYADLERPPKPKPVIKSSHSEGSKLPNFKRFKKASQGRFNSSLSSVSISCVIGGSEDLVDFRQLPQVA